MDPHRRATQTRLLRLDHAVKCRRQRSPCRRQQLRLEALHPCALLHRVQALGSENLNRLKLVLVSAGCWPRLRPTPPSREIVFHSESGICTIVSQPCFTTRNLRTKLCGIRSQTQKQEFVDPFKSWYLETRSDPEMENRLACGKHFSHKDSTKIWNGLYCITWNTILRIPDPESKTISRDSGVGRYRNEVRTNSDYRICTCSILYGLVSKPALPPESPQQIGFGAERYRAKYRHRRNRPRRRTPRQPGYRDTTEASGKRRRGTIPCGQSSPGHRMRPVGASDYWLMMMMFIPRGWNLFFSGTGTADFHPEVLEKARPISPLAEIRQNNARKNCGKDLNSTPWFAPFYCLSVCNQSRDY